MFVSWMYCYIQVMAWERMGVKKGSKGKDPHPPSGDSAAGRMEGYVRYCTTACCQITSAPEDPDLC